MKKFPLYLGGPIYDQLENVFGCWDELIVTRPYNNGFLLCVKSKYSTEQFFKN